MGLLALLLCVFLGVVYVQSTKALPEGIPYEGETHQLPAESISFLYDLTYQAHGETQYEQHMFKAVFEAIDEAEEFIVLDFFLYNDYYDADQQYPQLSSNLTKKLIDKKKKNPSIDITLITDEINTSYNSHKNWQFEELKEHGIDVLLTNVDPLRDSNPLYSAIWRMFFQWLGQKGTGIFPNAMADGAPKMTARSYLKMLNIKANHRKRLPQTTQYLFYPVIHMMPARTIPILDFKLTVPLFKTYWSRNRQQRTLQEAKNCPNIKEEKLQQGTIPFSW